jgi:phenylacetic acid degradation operon negative regulatory protein
MKNNLSLNLLTYINYCVTNRHFSYEKCQKDFANINIQINITTLRKEFSYAKSEGLLEFKTFYRKKYPVLSQKGKLAIKTNLPFKKYDWDGDWKVVMFDISNSRKNSRLSFQKKLMDLGFGKLGRGAYLSPYPLFTTVKRISRELKIENNITLFRANSIENEKEKVAKAWNLKKINNEYLKFIQKAREKSISAELCWPIIAKSLEKEFAALYGRDPHLPKELLPENWRGNDAYFAFRAIANSY